jgi:hypothetical protein
MMGHGGAGPVANLVGRPADWSRGGDLLSMTFVPMKGKMNGGQTG